jgi:hypothetical protein
LPKEEVFVAERVERPREAGAGRDVPVVTGPATVAAALAASRTELRVADVAALRLLALPRDPAPTTRELRLVVEFWEPPRPSWRGRLGPIDGLRSISLELDPQARRAEVRVQVARPVPIADLVAALMPALRPVGDLSGSGFSRLVVAPDAPEAVLSLLPGPVPRRPALFYTSLEGLHLRAGDLALQGPESGEEPVPHPGTQEPIATNALVVRRDGGIVATPRLADALVDLQVHNPVGRLAGWESSPASGSAQVGLEGETLRVLAADGTPLVEAPVGQPLELRHVRPLRRWGDASLAGLAGSVTGSDAARGADVVRRLVELAATGLVLHGLPEAPLPGGEVAHPDLLAMLGRPYETVIGLERDVRSVAQRRLAMRHHGGFFRLAEAVQASTGHRLLPHVSVVVSSRRPARMAQVLRMLARQTYPHFEVIAIMHGVPEPDLAPYAEELAGLDLRVIAADASTKFGAALAQGVRESRGDLVTKIDDDDWYSREHLWDLVLAWLYSGADIVGKTTEYLYFEGIDHTVHRRFATETYHEQVAGGAMLLSRSALDAIGGWRPTVNATDRSVLVGIYDNGGIGYRTHGLGYVYIRHDDGHTWAQQDSDLARNTYEQWRHLRLPEVPELADDVLMAP